MLHTTWFEDGIRGEKTMVDRSRLERFLEMNRNLEGRLDGHHA
jgi:hypothetical protein